MSDGPPFYRTVMGHRFYDATVPNLVAQLARLNDNLERLLKVMEGRHAPEEDEAAPPKEPLR